jgi:hypothetical protein
MPNLVKVARRIPSATAFNFQLAFDGKFLPGSWPNMLEAQKARLDALNEITGRLGRYVELGEVMVMWDDVDEPATRPVKNIKEID